jgi:hypothetical protein
MTLAHECLDAFASVARAPNVDEAVREHAASADVVLSRLREELEHLKRRLSGRL